MMYLSRTLGFCICLVAGWLCAAAGVAQVRPNVLLILADDMGFGDFGMAGNPYLKTPNLDRMARESASFSNFYVSPVCAPTRASLLTGRYHQRTGVRSVTNGYETLNPEEVTMAELFGDAGYRTGIFGKWHLGENYPSVPRAQGFDQFTGFRTGHTDDYFDPVLERNGEYHPTKGYITDVLTKEAMGFMRSSTKPFFCYLPFNAPHTPLDVPEKYLSKYREKGIEEKVARVYGMIDNLDENIGRLLAFLRQERLEKNTIVIFLSDNGPISSWRGGPETWRFNCGLRDQKFSIYEGGIRTQFFMRWPGNIEPRSLSEPAAHIDVLPTLMEMCNVTGKTLSLDGIDLSCVIKSGECDHVGLSERILFMNYDLSTLQTTEPYPGGIARKGKFKLVNGTELYDLNADPGETVDVATRHPEIADELRHAYLGWWKESVPEDGFTIRPVAVGFTTERETTLTPHQGRVEGTLQFFGMRGMHSGLKNIGTHPSGVDGDWLSNWTSPTDKVSWNITAIEEGSYEVAINVANTADTAQVIICIDEQCLAAEIPAAASKGNEEPSFMPVSCGTIFLKRGDYIVQVRAAPDAPASLKLGSVRITKTD